MRRIAGVFKALLPKLYDTVLRSAQVVAKNECISIFFCNIG